MYCSRGAFAGLRERAGTQETPSPCLVQDGVLDQVCRWHFNRRSLSMHSLASLAVWTVIRYSQCTKDDLPRYSVAKKQMRRRWRVHSWLRCPPMAFPFVAMACPLSTTTTTRTTTTTTPVVVVTRSHVYENHENQTSLVRLRCTCRDLHLSGGAHWGDMTTPCARSPCRWSRRERRRQHDVVRSTVRTAPEKTFSLPVLRPLALVVTPPHVSTMFF